MKEEVKTKRKIQQVESFKEDGIFYSFKYDYLEFFGEGKKYFELRSPITVLVENQDQKRLYFNFKADTTSDLSYGKLSVVARNETPLTKQKFIVGKEDDRVRVNFNSLNESAEFTTILNRVHAECVKIVSSRFKDAITENDAKSFFS